MIQGFRVGYKLGAGWLLFFLFKKNEEIEEGNIKTEIDKREEKLQFLIPMTTLDFSLIYP